MRRNTIEALKANFEGLKTDSPKQSSDPGSKSPHSSTSSFRAAYEKISAMSSSTAASSTNLNNANPKPPTKQTTIVDTPSQIESPTLLSPNSAQGSATTKGDTPPTTTASSTTSALKSLSTLLRASDMHLNANGNSSHPSPPRSPQKSLSSSLKNSDHAVVSPSQHSPNRSPKRSPAHTPLSVSSEVINIELPNGEPTSTRRERSTTADYAAPPSGLSASLPIDQLSAPWSSAKLSVSDSTDNSRNPSPDMPRKFSGESSGGSQNRISMVNIGLVTPTKSGTLSLSSSDQFKDSVLKKKRSVSFTGSFGDMRKRRPSVSFTQSKQGAPLLDELPITLQETKFPLANIGFKPNCTKEVHPVITLSNGEDHQLMSTKVRVQPLEQQTGYSISVVALFKEGEIKKYFDTATLNYYYSLKRPITIYKDKFYRVEHHNFLCFESHQEEISIISVIQTDTALVCIKQNSKGYQEFEIPCTSPTKLKKAKLIQELNEKGGGMEKFSIAKLSSSKPEIRKEILQIDITREHMTNTLKLGVLFRRTGQNHLYEIIENNESTTSPEFEVFLNEMEIAAGVFNAPRILTWEDKQVSCFVGPVMDQDKIREQIGNSTGVIIFNGDGDSFDPTDLHLGQVSHFICVVTPVRDGENAMYYRIGFYINYEYKYFSDNSNQDDDISIAIQEMTKLASTVYPLVPRDYYFNSKEMKDFIFTCVNNAIITASNYHAIVKKLYQRPCAHLIKAIAQVHNPDWYKTTEAKKDETIKTS